MILTGDVQAASQALSKFTDLVQVDALPGDAQHRLSLQRVEGRWQIGGLGDSAAESTDALLATVLAGGLNLRALLASRRHLLLHAGAVAFNGEAIVLSGPSGAGKTTLVAELVAHGAEYLSDEIAAIEVSSGLLLPYPKPFSVKAGARIVFDASDVDTSSARCIRVGDHGAVAVKPARPTAIIALARGSADSPRLEALKRSLMLLHLAENSSYLSAHGPAALPRLAALVCSAQCLRLAYTDAATAADLAISTLKRPH